MKWFMWPMATLTHPKFSRCRIEITKPIALIYIIDDIFDVYGSLDELILFTEAINRELCDVFLKEAKWFRSCHIPDAEEYLTNAVITSGVHTIYVHLLFILGEGISKESMGCLEGHPTIISSLVRILRLWDDLGNAKVYNDSYVC
ncbi:hypothetical protein QJS04_geneDACA005242 [Acorus gramineus]|uniref:Terpene synthase metal-binding domain-containing protein n=1 Tax=Acorus gramineus TaxID=55184 RepID=A0AAV9AVU7_ACOGR|nr:hypothetical protein QJS04_geneDACA005242 [Acorus gramineus]